MTRSKALPLLLLLAIMLGSWARLPAVAAAGRPLLAGEQAHAEVVDSVIVLPSLRRPWHKLPALEMKPAGHSCETWSPNNKDCPPPPTKP
ncbi:hypothetical protein BAE44_0018934 [Dichanthelium oligosanthes]|uniref:Uncharacterized protein n=1 Tax=Dichanthelium oligosanthes TaxID=888268 RepID=A0A1E5V4G5_9POAL|nr:hypothetical protein BAE44_0018934 [Dichanthelium oligosanthes]